MFIESNLYISCNGDVKTCCDTAYDNDAYTIGNLYAESLEDILIRECTAENRYSLKTANVIYYTKSERKNNHGKKNNNHKTVLLLPGVRYDYSVPDDRDTEEYIDELLDGILSDEARYNTEWDFTDGIS